MRKSSRAASFIVFLMVTMVTGNAILLLILRNLASSMPCRDQGHKTNSVSPDITLSAESSNSGSTGVAEDIFPSGRPTSPSISCEKLSSGDEGEMAKVDYIMHMSPKQVLMDEVYPTLTHNCSQYIHSRGFIVSPVSEEEKNFPIAFSIMIYKHIEQVERLLRAVWRPTNVYCISIDAKAQQEFAKGVHSIARCFDNVFVHPTRVDVQWGTYTVLQPELLCMELLWKSEKNWNYFINLTGQEYPLKTNYELIQILKAYSGANDIAGTYQNAEPGRWELAGEPPFNLKPRKGAVHIVACRGYVDYVLHHNVSAALLEWVKNTAVPDEAFFTMLNYNPRLGVPGSYTGDVDDGRRMYLGRYKLWFPFQKCSGRIARNICIMEIGDLPDLVRAPHLFVNKFFYDHHPVAYDCLENWYRHKVELERQGRLTFNTTFYRNRWIVSHHF